MKCLDIFQYYDYRVLLADYYRVRKSMDSRFSYRSFNARAGITSQGLFQRVVQGEVRITPRTLPKFAVGMGLEPLQLEFFKLMVEYTHATSNGAKQRLFAQMLPLLPKREQRIANNQKEYYSAWHYTAVHQALYIFPLRNNYKALADFINPRISVVETKRAVHVLQELGMIQKDMDGFWRPVARRLSGSGKEVGAIVIQEFQNKMMDIAKQAQFSIPKEMRNMATTTMTVSRTGLALVRKKISDFQKDIAEFVSQDTDEQFVYQLNIQFFPLSNDLKEVANTLEADDD